MHRHYDHLATYERDGFEIIVDRTWEDLDPKDLFDDSVMDIKEIYSKIDRGIYEWFMLRVRALFEGHELGSAYLGGMLYENARECLTDGSAEDMIAEALKEAKLRAADLKIKLAELTV